MQYFASDHAMPRSPGAGAGAEVGGGVGAVLGVDPGAHGPIRDEYCDIISQLELSISIVI